MSQEERTQLIREIKELIYMDNESKLHSRGSIFDQETLKLMKALLSKMLAMSL